MSTSSTFVRIFGLALGFVVIAGARLSAQSASVVLRPSSQAEADSLWLAAPQSSWLDGSGDIKTYGRQLSDAQLMAAYQKPDFVWRADDSKDAERPRPYPLTEEMLRGAVIIIPEDPRYRNFLAIRAEIERRGTAMRPFLIAFLRRASTSELFVPASYATGVGTLYVSDALKLLAPLREGKGGIDAALVCVEILEAAPRIEVRWQALQTLEQLTLCGYFRGQRQGGRDIPMVARENAAPLEVLTYENAPRVAAWYRSWLRGEGSNPNQWLSLAQKRARDDLASHDLDKIYGAASFLSAYSEPFSLEDIRFPHQTRDPAPDRTAARLAQILAAARPTQEIATGGNPNGYTFDGQVLPEKIESWARLLANYGENARPFAAVLMRLQEREGFDGPDFFAALSRIGGKEVVGTFVRWLPQLEQRKRDLNISPEGSEPTLTQLPFSRGEREQAVGRADLIARSTIDRWAGRAFADNAGRLAWWETAKNQTPEEWLRASLNDTVTRADAGDFNARNILRQILPQMPVGSEELRGQPHVFNSLISTAAPASKPFRARWIAQHRRRLRYDPVFHALLLTPPAS